MKLNRTEFIQALKKALPGVESAQSIIEGADTFVFSQDIIHAYNDSISVSVPFKTGLKGAVKAMDFFKLVSKMPTDEISIEAIMGNKGEDGIINSSFIIQSGKSEAEMTNIQNTLEEYITTLKLDKIKWEQIPGNFFDAIKLCKIACNKAPMRGIFVNGTIMLSTDISRINRHFLNSSMQKFWLDDPSVSEVLKIDKIIEYAVQDSWIHFKGSDGIIFSCKLKDDSSFPQPRIMEIIAEHDKGKDDIENVLPENTFNVIDRVSILSSDMDNVPAIKMTISKTSINFSAQKVSGKINESLDFQKPFEQDVNIKLWIDPSFLVEASRKVQGFYIKNMNNGIHLVFNNKDYIQIASTIAEK